jgi:DNA-binding CsgD family transcriptional regulator
MAYSAIAPGLPGAPTIDQSWLAAALEHLPVAVGLVDHAGRFISLSGALRSMLGDRIPSRSERLKQRWIVSDATGAPLDPCDWPSERALRGEIVFPGSAAQYLSKNAPPRAMRVTAAPITAQGMSAKAVVLVQEIDIEVRAKTQHHDHLEARFAEALLRSISDMVRSEHAGTPEQGQAALAHVMGLPIIASPPAVEDLTLREDQVLKLLAWGASQKEVGACLGVSAKTVDFHRIRATKKLNLRTRTDLIRYAVRRGWFVEEAM